jgi:tetratricopeptide (TPR) repeat protein
MALDAVYGGDFAAATSLIAEADAICEATGSRIAPYAAMLLTSFRGSEAEAAPLIQSTLEEAAAGGQGAAVTWAHRAAAILYNGLSRHQEALAAARQASEHRHVYVSMSALPELIEAAVRTGSVHMASDALDLLAERARAGGTEDGLGIEARSRALLSDPEAADGYYREAIDRLGRTRRRPVLARAHLLYGEWLRRERRRGEAREQLRTAYEMLDAMGMAGFAERARHELQATGDTLGKRTVQAARGGTVGVWEALTTQEAQVARLARDGLSNPESTRRALTRMLILVAVARTRRSHAWRYFRNRRVIPRRARLPRGCSSARGRSSTT